MPGFLYYMACQSCPKLKSFPTPHHSSLRNSTVLNQLFRQSPQDSVSPLPLAHFLHLPINQGSGFFSEIPPEPSAHHLSPHCQHTALASLGNSWHGSLISPIPHLELSIACIHLLKCKQGLDRAWLKTS